MGYLRAREQGSWSTNHSWVIEKDGGGTGVIDVDDAIYLRARTGNHLEVFESACPFVSPTVHVRYDMHGERTRFIIERDGQGRPERPPLPTPEDEPTKKKRKRKRKSGKIEETDET